MSIRRTRYKFETWADHDKTSGVVTLFVNFDGTCEDRGDALLMILDAWDDAMKEQGLDPLKSHMAFQREGKLQ